MLKYRSGLLFLLSLGMMTTPAQAQAYAVVSQATDTAAGAALNKFENPDKLPIQFSLP